MINRLCRPGNSKRLITKQCPGAAARSVAVGLVVLEAVQGYRHGQDERVVQARGDVYPVAVAHGEPGPGDPGQRLAPAVRPDLELVVQDVADRLQFGAVAQSMTERCRSGDTTSFRTVATTVSPCSISIVSRTAISFLRTTATMAPLPSMSSNVWCSRSAFP